MDPGELPQRCVATSFRHPGQAEVDAVCENRGEQRRAIVGGPPAALMGEAFRKAGPSIDLQQQIGDLDSWHQVVGGLRQRPGLGRLLRLQRRDTQHAGVQRRVVQRASFSPRGRVRHRVGQRRAPHGEILRRVLGDADRQRSLGTQHGEGWLWKKAVLEIAISPAAVNPNVAGAQSVAKFGQHAHLPGPTVRLAVRVQHKGAPASANERDRRRRGQGALAGAVAVAKQRYRLEQAGRARRALELESVEQRRRELSHRRPSKGNASRPAQCSSVSSRRLAILPSLARAERSGAVRQTNPGGQAQSVRQPWCRYEKTDTLQNGRENGQGQLWHTSATRASVRWTGIPRRNWMRWLLQAAPRCFKTRPRVYVALVHGSDVWRRGWVGVESCPQT
jgi:hypothetical protein